VPFFPSITMEDVKMIKHSSHGLVAPAGVQNHTHEWSAARSPRFGIRRSSTSAGSCMDSALVHDRPVRIGKSPVPAILGHCN
jgi:hypothetical protein